MSQKLHLAANLVSESLVYGHLQIVYEDSSGDLLETETTSPGFPFFWGDWAFPTFGRRHDDPDNTPNINDPDRYSRVSLDLRDGQTATHVWELLAQVHASLSGGDHGLDYDIRQNSNSFAATMLWIVGIDIDDYLDAVTPPDVSDFPGVDTNILTGAKTGGLFSGYDTPIPLGLTGTAGNDYIRTGIGDDTLGGAAGDDDFHAGGGADSVFGGAGNDTLDGGSGDDVIHGDRGSDLVIGGNGRDFAELGAGKDIFVDNDQGGSHGRDTVLAGSGADTIDGGSGNDLFDGGSGADLIGAGRGDDVVFGGRGYDTIFGGEGNDTVDGGFGCDRAILFDGDDVFLDNNQVGEHSHDRVFAGSGHDTVHAGGGNDTITGSAGADVFVFVGNTIDHDVVTDFRPGVDTLWLDEVLWGGGLPTADVLWTFADDTLGMVVFDFGFNNTISLTDVADLEDIAPSDLVLF